MTWLLKIFLCHAAIDEAVEAFHLSPALEILHTAMAIAGDETAQVTLLSRSHLAKIAPFHWASPVDKMMTETVGKA